jgi:hypothetical protein
MRYLIIALIFIIGCKKEKTQQAEKQSDYIFYKIKQVNLDSEINYTETRLVRTLTLIPPYSEDTCCHCTVPLQITKFEAYLLSGNIVRLDWTCENEEGINYYMVCKSRNNKDWMEIRVDKLFGKYTYLD